MLDRSVAPQYSKVTKINFKKAESIHLDNGIPLHYIKLGSQPVLKAEIIIPAGKWYERKNGLAYFTSQMLSEGTKAKSSAEISEALEMYGAQLDINAGNDYIMITLYTLSKYFENLVNILYEILYEPSFPSSEFKKLVKRQISHLRIQNNKNNYLASKYFREALFGKSHPYGYYPTEEAIKKLNQSDLIEYHRSSILNSNIEIILSGNVLEKHINLVNKKFPLSESNGISDFLSFKSIPGKKDLSFDREGSLQTSLRIGKKIMNKKDPDYHKLTITTTLLGGFFGSRLMKNIREDKGFSYGINANIVNFIKDSFFVIATDVKKELRDEAINEIKKEVQKLRSEPPEEAELELVKNYITGSFQGDVNTPFQLAEKFKSIYLHGLNYDFYDTFFETIQKITPDDITDMTQKYLDPASFTIVKAG